MSFAKVAPFTLKVDFDDGTTQVIDFRPVLKGDLYGALDDVSVFDQVQLDTQVHTLVWPNGADFDPTMLHNWPNVSSELIKLAEKWTPRRAGFAATS